MKRSQLGTFLLAAALLTTGGAAGSASATSAASVQRLQIAGGGQVSKLDERLAHAVGPVEVWVSLADPAVAAYKSERLAQRDAEMQARRIARAASDTSAFEDTLRAELRAHRQSLRERQSAILSSLRAMGAQELARVQVAHNAVALRVDASALPEIAQMAGVATVRPVVHYQQALGETVPYVGAAAAHAAGKDGTGVVIAVLDSGVDYTHRNLGGPGTEAAYLAAYGVGPGAPENETRDGLFPTAKVIEGFDFVGEAWPNAPRTEDPDPIDFDGHGTHVADIAAGASLDGTHKGVAPGAKLLAVKVCSAISPSCNGIALLRGMDFALDPNGDGDTSDAADVINMSLGSSYGQEQDDLSEASANAVRLGVVVVAAAGNSADRPYIVSSPSSGLGVISVAQTHVPSALSIPVVVVSPGNIAGTYPNTAGVGWAPVGAGAAGDVAFVGRGCPAGSIGPGSPEDPYSANPAGKIALIDRGSCAVSLKVDRAAKAGATGVLIGLVAPGDPISFSFGGGDTFVPTLVIQQSLSNAIKANIAAPVNVRFTPADGIPLVGSMVASSSRGPTVSDTHIKPEIGAPGASRSAEVGTGSMETAFGGTSGATPMVAGAAALLIQAHPHRSPEQIKALLMNSAEPQILTSPALVPGQLAPITRIGAGELRVDRALKLTALARERKSRSAALSFGFHNVAHFATLERTLVVENLSHRHRTFAVETSFRFADDEASGAVRLFAPSHVHVPPRGKAKVHVSMFIDGKKLPDWPLDGGPNGGNGPLLNAPEFDGYITLTDSYDQLSVPWHVLPRKSALMLASPRVKAGRDVHVVNAGITTGEFDVFALTGVSPRADRSELPGPGDNFALIDMRAVGVRLVAPGILQFAVNSFGRRAHPNYPAEFDVYIDTNRDGIFDFVAFNAENGGFGASGQNVVGLFNFATGTTLVRFFTDADLQSGNAILTVLTSDLGMTDSTQFDFQVFAFDNYFTGNLTDEFGPMTFTPDKPRFIATDVPAGVAPHSVAHFGTEAVEGGEAASPSQIGLLLMHRLDAGREASLVRIR